MLYPYRIIAFFLCTALCACGCGSGGGNSGASANISLNSGSPMIDNSQLAAGILSINFPDAIGNQPYISNITATSAQDIGIADLRSQNDITTDTIPVYFPRPGNYNITVTVSDDGDSDQQSQFNVTIPSSQTYALSGQVKDGVLNSEAGVRTHVRLYWHPIHYPNTQIAITASNPSSNGDYQFSQLIGSADFFRISVDDGTH